MENKKLFIIIFLMALSLYFITGGRAFYNLSMLVLVVLLLNYLIVRNNIRKIDSNFVINREEHVVLDEISFKYILVNKSIVPIYNSSVNLVLSEDFGLFSTRLEDMSFRPNQIIELKRKFIAKRRGYYKIGKLEVQVSDLFNIFRKKRELDKSIYIKIYPKIIDFERLKEDYSGALGSINSSISSLNDFTNIRSFREYQIGDNLKNIHYKLSARNKKLYVKEFYESNYIDYTIITDGSFREKLRISSEEKSISISLSIAKYILSRSGQVQYIISNKSSLKQSLKNMEDFKLLYERILDSYFDSEISLGDYLKNYLRSMVTKTRFIIITSEIDKKLVGSLISMKNQANKIILYLIDCSDREVYRELILALESNDIRVLYIDEDIRLEYL